MLSYRQLNDLVAEARPIIERQLDDAERIAAFRDVVASSGGDWSALKALIKAQIQDERDETGDGKRVKKILEKAGFSTGYAELLGWSNMNEKNFSADDQFDPITGEFLEDIRTAPETAEEAEPEAAAEVAGNDLREPVAAEQGQIIREGDAPRETGRLGGDASCPDTEFQVGGNVHISTAARNDAGKQGVTAGETAPHSEKATVATQGEATAPTSAEREDCASANAGGTDVARSAPRAGQELTSKTGEGAANTALPAKSRLRPNCLQPELCRSGTRDHCYSCRKAMEQEDAA